MRMGLRLGTVCPAVDLGQEFAELLAEPTNPAHIKRFVALLKGDHEGILLPQIHSALRERPEEDVAGAYICHSG